MRHTVLTTIMLGLAAMMPALAVPITISFSDTESTTFTPGALEFVLPGFDPSLGTLQSVMFEFTGTLEASGTVTNGSDQDGTISGSVNAIFDVDGPAPLGTILTVTPSAALGPQAIGAGQTLTYNPAITGTQMGSVTFTDPADLALFILAGNLSFQGTSGSQLAPLANFTPVTIEFDQSGMAMLEVFYTYTQGVPEIPEPGTMTLLAAGFALLGLSRVRRRERA